MPYQVRQIVGWRYVSYSSVYGWRSPSGNTPFGNNFATGMLGGSVCFRDSFGPAQSIVEVRHAHTIVSQQRTFAILQIGCLLFFAVCFGGPALFVPSACSPSVSAWLEQLSGALPVSTSPMRTMPIMGHTPIIGTRHAVAVTKPEGLRLTLRCLLLPSCCTLLLGLLLL